MNVKKTKIKINSLLMKNFRKVGLLIALIILIAAFGIMSGGRFLSVHNLLTVARQVSITLIVCVGLTFVMITGNIDLALGSYLALSGIVVAKILGTGMNWVVAILLTMAAFAVLQSFLGTIIAKQKLMSLIVTLAMMSIARGIALSWSGGKPVYIENDAFMSIGIGYFGKIPIPIVIALIVLIIGEFTLRKTKFGRYVYAVGGNEESALTAGVYVDRIKILVYVISGALTALAGCVMGARLFSGSPVTGQGFEMDAIASVVIGGTSLTGGYGTMIGTLIGAFTVGIISNGLTILGVDYYYQLIAKGLIIFLAVYIDSRARRS